MASNLLLNVATAFKFEVGSALASSNKLGKSLDSLSSKAGNLQNQLKISAVQWGASLTGAQFGMISFVKQALDGAEQTYDIQRRMATLITNNNKAFKEGPLGMAESMKISEKIMKSMVMEADKFGLNINDYMYKVEGINAALFGKGATGVNFENSRKLARNVMIGSEMLPGLENIDIQNSMLSLVMGQARRGQKFFDTLRADTGTFKNVSASSFNRKKAADRVELLNKGFEELIKNEDALIARMNSLSVQLTRVQNRLTGVYNIFYKIGEVARQFLIENLKLVNTFIDAQLRPAFDKLGGVLSDLVQGKSLVELYFQLEKLSTVGKSLNVSKTLASTGFLVFELIGLARSIPYLNRVFIKMAKSLGFVAVLGGRLGKFTALLGVTRKIMGFLVRGLVFYAKFWTAAFTVSRILEKAKTIARQEDLKKLGSNLSSLTVAGVDFAKSLYKLARPFIWLTDKVAELIAPFMSLSFWVEKLGKVAGVLIGRDIKTTEDAANSLSIMLDKIGNAFIKLTAFLSAGIVHLNQLTSGSLVSPLNPLLKTLGFLSEGGSPKIEKPLTFHERYEKYKKEMMGTKPPEEEQFVQNNITNIAKVEVRNQFSENFDADRVAATLVNQILEAATNPLGTGANNPVKLAGLQTDRR